MSFSRSPNPTGKGPFVKIHPQESLKYLNPVYLGNPATFVPKESPKTRQFENWGTTDTEEDLSLRALLNLRFYHNAPTPEQQFVRALADIKKKRLDGIDVSKLSKRDYILKVGLCDALISSGNDFVWRTFKVSGGLSLNTLADKVIFPGFGWARNYHCYIFTDRKDGALFGPTKSIHTDVFQILDNQGYLGDHKYTIAHLLQEEGEQLGFLYDLDHEWIHTITVESIVAENLSNGRIDIRGGSGACPPEDGEGNKAWQKKLNRLRRRPDDASIHKQLKISLNYRDEPGVNASDWVFKPNEFDINGARKRIFEALASPASVSSGAKLFLMPDPLGLFGLDLPCEVHTTPKYLEGLRYTPPETYIKGNAEDRYGYPGTYLTECITKPGKADRIEVAVCEACGTPRELKKCLGCKGVYYCGKECQTTRWAKHKALCRAIGRLAAEQK